MVELVEETIVLKVRGVVTITQPWYGRWSGGEPAWIFLLRMPRIFSGVGKEAVAVSEGTDRAGAGSRGLLLGRAGEDSDELLFSAPGRSPALDADQLEVLRRYGTERDVAAGEVLFADGDETYDLIVMLDGTAEIIQGYGRPDATLIAAVRPVPVPRRDRHAHRAAWPT